MTDVPLAFTSGVRFGAAEVECLSSSPRGHVSIRVKTDAGLMIDLDVTPKGRDVTVKKIDRRRRVTTHQRFRVAP